MDKNFITLTNETLFARSCLGLGLTQIRQANYSELGTYCQAFINLSVGLERLAKIVILLDYLIYNNGNYPNFKTLKNYGHNLNELYSKSQEISNRNNIKFQYYSQLTDEIHTNILDILSNFAKGDRYANLDFLTGENDKNPVADWSKNVDDWIWDNKVTEFKKELIIKNASLWRLIENYCLYINEKNEIIKDSVKASEMTGKWESISQYRILYMAQIVRYWIEILNALAENLDYKNGIIMPDFSRIFVLFMQDDNYIKKRKDWTRKY